MSAKIGIFDSGIGGLTVAKAIKNQLPQAELVYFGDTAHLPYGDKSPASIRHYSARITQFLLSKRCNAVVIACNTASAHAHKTVKDVAGPDVPVFNVIDPVVECISKGYSHKKVGIIATKGTIKTRVYPRRIKIANDTITVASKATPLLAPMIEEGFFNNSISKTVINNYLKGRELKDISALVLGCTHYPLIQKEVEEFFKHSVDIIDSANVVASAIAHNYNLSASHSGKDEFFVSDYTKGFEKSTQTFFGEKITLTEERIFD
ncbi:MAG: glutamate racemase [Flavobacteriales bacterium]